MNLKDYYKQLLSEEIIRSTPRQAALVRQNLGLPPASTVERLGGTEHKLPMGSDWNVLTRRFIKRAIEIGDKEGRDLYKSVPASNRTGRAAATAFTGTKNWLLHGTGQNPDEVGLNMDLVSAPRIAQRQPPKPEEQIYPSAIMHHPKFEDAKHALKHLFDFNLQPGHAEGLDLNDPNFTRDLINRIAYSQSRGGDSGKPPIDYKTYSDAIWRGIIPSRHL
jgi:hypothetical protein